MKNVGIIAEYNPFHFGHAYHIEQAKRLSGAENAIVAMSASFVQRGEPACLDKFKRTELALAGGADLVVELPDILSLACAERFSSAGIRILAGTGMVDALAFGSELGDIDLLKAAAALPVEGAAFEAALKSGSSYPRAVSEQLENAGISLSDSPNDLLGLEYLRQLAKFAPSITPFAVKRIGSGYNSTESSSDGGFASAAFIRRLANDGLYDELKKQVPDFVYNTIIAEYNAGRFPASVNALSGMVIHSLRSLGKGGITALPDVSEGLENPIYRSALASSSMDELLAAVKSKRYTMARLKRIMMYALLGATKALQDAAFEDENALYIRVLGVRREKRGLLSELSCSASLPVVTGYSDIEKLPPAALKTLEYGARAHLIHSLAFPKRVDCIEDFSHPLIVI